MPTLPARQRRHSVQETVTLRVSPANKKKLLALVKVLHLGKVETLEDKVARFMSITPAMPPLTDEEINDLAVAEVRAYRTENAARRAAGLGE